MKSITVIGKDYITTLDGVYNECDIVIEDGFLKVLQSLSEKITYINIDTIVRFEIQEIVQEN